MTETDLKLAIKNAVQLYEEKTYNLDDLQAHLLMLVKENSEPAKKHIDQLERLIFKVEELLIQYRVFWGGKKSAQVICKELEVALMHKINWLLANGYSIERYKGKGNDNVLFK